VRETIALLPQRAPTVFKVEDGSKDALFRRTRDASRIPNLHFVDSRAETIWRLSENLYVMKLAKMIGYRDLKSLMLYYNADPDELADRPQFAHSAPPAARNWAFHSSCHLLN